VSERYEALVDDKEDVLDIKNALKCVEDFKNHCEHYLLMSGVEGFDWNANKKNGENPLFSAIMNSVDWEELLEDVKKDLDVE
jgi:hypothetical protein